jgi:photosystem II stability/assembly factor-like uncharacterized protein
MCAGDNGIGASVIKTTDGGDNWTVLQIHEPALIFSSIASTSEEVAVANGIGLMGSGGTQYSTGTLRSCGLVASPVRDMLIADVLVRLIF